MLADWKLLILEIQLGQVQFFKKKRFLCSDSVNNFQRKSLLRAPLSRIKTSLLCCQYFFTAGYKYLGNKMKQKYFQSVLSGARIKVVVKNNSEKKYIHCIKLRLFIHHVLIFLSFRMVFII